MNFFKLQLVRQIMGAVGGSLVALALYQAYELAAPRVLAMLPSPRMQITQRKEADVYTSGDRKERQDRIVQIARARLGLAED
jgi:hypothetical protein